MHKGPGQVRGRPSREHVPLQNRVWDCSPDAALQAGNKSALTYRCDIGVPGYTGYIPQTAAMPLQTKGSSQYIGVVVVTQDSPGNATPACVAVHTHYVGDCTSAVAGRGCTVAHKETDAINMPDFHTTSW